MMKFRIPYNGDCANTDELIIDGYAAVYLTDEVVGEYEVHKKFEVIEIPRITDNEYIKDLDRSTIECLNEVLDRHGERMEDMLYRCVDFIVGLYKRCKHVDVKSIAFKMSNGASISVVDITDEADNIIGVGDAQIKNKVRASYLNKLTRLLRLSRINVIGYLDDSDRGFIGGLTSSYNSFGRCTLATDDGSIFMAAYKEVDTNSDTRDVIVSDVREINQYCVRGSSDINKYMKFYYPELGSEVRTHMFIAAVMGLYDGKNLCECEVNHKNLNSIDNSMWNLEVINSTQNKSHGKSVRHLIKDLHLSRDEFFRLVSHNKYITEMLSYYTVNDKYLLIKSKILDMIKCRKNSGLLF